MGGFWRQQQRQLCCLQRQQRCSPLGCLSQKRVLGGLLAYLPRSYKEGVLLLKPLGQLFLPTMRRCLSLWAAFRSENAPHGLC